MKLLLASTSFIVLGLVSYHSFADDYANSNYKPNGNYASIGIGYVSSTAKNPPCQGTDCYKTQTGPEASLGLQLSALPNLVFGVSGSVLTSPQQNTTLTSTGTSYSVALIGGFGPFDAGIAYSNLHSTVKVCTNGSNSVCASSSDTGADFGALAKIWFGTHLNIGVTLDKYSFSTSTTTYTSTGYSLSLIPARRHSFTFEYSSTVDQNNIPISTGGSISYAYLF